MPIVRIDELDDPRIRDYRDVKAQNVMRNGAGFLVEGTRTVERLLASSYETTSILLTEDRLPEWQDRLRDDFTTYVVTRDLANQILGFQFHVGVMGCGKRRRSPELADLVKPILEADRGTLVVLPNCDNPENLGAIIRLATGFGVAGLLLGRSCCDPFSRRVIRVSMGAAFEMPIRTARDLASDLTQLREEWGFVRYGTVIDRDATPLYSARPAVRSALLFGNEAAGLTDEWRALCDERTTIPLTDRVDSLNVAVAAGIFLHWWQAPPGCVGPAGVS